MNQAARHRPFLPSDLPPADPLKNWVRNAAALAIATLQKSDVATVAENLWGGDSVESVTKAAVGPASSTGWGSELATTGVGPFLRDLAPRSGAASLFAAAEPIDLGRHAAIWLPRLDGEFPPATFVAEGAPIPVLQGALDNVLLGPRKKLAAITGVTGELASYSGGAAEVVIRGLMLRAAAKALDGAVFSAEAESEIRPAGLFADVTPLTATAGGGEDALLGDLDKLMGAIADAGLGMSPMFFASPRRALRLKALLKSPRFDVDILPVLGMSNTTVAAVEAGAIASSVEPVPRIDLAKAAVLHWDDDPSPLSTAGTPNTVAAPTRSAFQNDLVVLRLIWPMTWAVRAEGAVQLIENVTW